MGTGWRAWAGTEHGGRFVPSADVPTMGNELVFLGALSLNGEEVEVFEERVPDGRPYYDYVPRLWARLKGE
jgi:hypothetical protein